MGVTKDPRRAKINELKQNIKLSKDEITSLLKMIRRIGKKKKRFLEKRETELAERLETPTKEWRNKLTGQRAVTDALNEELKLTRMNKNSSKFFEWIPSPMNRRQRKQLSKLLNAGNINLSRQAKATS